MSQTSQNKTWEPKDKAPTLNHQRAGQIWDTRIGEARVQAYNWRRATFLMGAISLLSISGLIAQSFKQDVVPYLVEVESEGQVRLVGQVREQDWSLKESAKKKQLHDWIVNLRGLSSDPQIVKERQAYVYIRATNKASLQLELYHEKQDPLKSFGEQTRTVHVESTTQIEGSENAYRVVWKEHVFGEQGDDLGVESFIGEFHLSIVPPKDEAMLETNPLGVYVSFFDFDQKK